MITSPIARLAPHLLVGLEGPILTERERELLSAFPPAGIILFARNVSDAAQLGRLTADIRDAASGRAGLRPLIAADHEGGRISVLAAAIGAPPAQMAIARADASVPAGLVYAETARRMRRCGVNTLLAPLADINAEYLNPVIGVRSFGEDRDEVARLVRAAVAALDAGGIASCLKHFPGHGSSLTDSHHELPQLPFTAAELRGRDMVPFSAGIEAGAETVMTAHVVPHGQRLPASIDPAIVSMLRDELGFGGVVMTDALEMAGVRVCGGSADAGGAPEERSVWEIACRSLSAGNDILVFSRPLQEVVLGLRSREEEAAGLLDSYTGKAQAASLERIGRLRASLGDRRGADAPAGADSERPGPASGVSDPPRAGDFYGEAARHAVRHLGGDPSRLPLSGTCVLSFIGERIDFENHIVMRFARGLAESIRARGGVAPVLESLGRESFRSVARCRAPGTGKPMEIVAAEARNAPASATAVRVLVNRRPIPSDLCAALCAGGEIIVAAGWPYAARFLPPEAVSIVTYGEYDAAVDALAAMLLGRAERQERA